MVKLVGECTEEWTGRDAIAVLARLRMNRLFVFGQ
jgi:hypothetical protein